MRKKEAPETTHCIIEALVSETGPLAKSGKFMAAGTIKEIT